MDKERIAPRLPCVVYLHGNTSSRYEALPYLQFLLPSNITLFCFDFSGCGKSEGEYISLGWWEREDLKNVIDFIKTTGRTSQIVLWGRSMGAATGLLYAIRDESIAGIIADSSFSNLTELIQEIAAQLVPNMLSVLRSMLIWFIKRSVKNRADFNIDDVNPIEVVDKLRIPVQFIVAEDDTFVLPRHGTELYKKYGGEKELIRVLGDHNTQRPAHVMSKVYAFLCRVLEVDKLPGYKAPNPNTLLQKEPIAAFPQAVFPVTKVLKQRNILSKESITYLSVEDPISFILNPEEELNVAIKLSIESYNNEKNKNTHN